MSNGRHLTVLLVEDHAVVREGTREILERDGGLEVVGEADDGSQAVALAARCAPDVALLDLNLPGINGIEVTRRLRALASPPAVLILTAYDDADYVLAAAEAGATGYILKTAHAADVVAAIRAVARGEVVLHHALATELVHRARGDARSVPLSPHELQILRLAARGMRNREIASELCVSSRTVESHLTAIFTKLGVASRTEAIVHAASHGWLALDREPPPAGIRVG